MMRALLVGLVASVSAAGCIQSFESVWYSPERLDAYALPGNEIPADLIEEVQLAGTQVEGEDEAPTLHGLWAKQCADTNVCRAGAPPSRQRLTVLYFHGNAANLDRYWDRVQILWRLGFTVFAIDYRGYGRSTGTPSEAGLYADARTALDHVETRAPRERVIDYGFSLGSTAAVQLATERPPVALVLEAPLASAQAFVDDAIDAGIDSRTLMDTQFDNIGKIPFVLPPKLIMHGTEDDFVRTTFGEQLFARAQEPKELWLVEGAEHGNVPCPEKDPDVTPEDEPCIATEAYDETVGSFLDTWTR